MAVSAPSGSSVPSSTVGTEKAALPAPPTRTVRAPVLPALAKSPLSTTFTFTWIAGLGAGVTVIVNTALPPSVMSEPAAMLALGGPGGSSSSAMVSVWVLAVPTA